MRQFVHKEVISNSGVTLRAS